DRGLVEIEACGLHHHIEVSLDRIAQRPKIDHIVEEISVKNGTSVKISWPSIASLGLGWEAGFYPRTVSECLADFIGAFAAFNPHATFRFGERVYAATDPAWGKWRADAPTSPHWYRPEDLRDLIHAYLAHEDGGPPMTVRDFVAEFAGLSGTQHRKKV